MPSQSASRQNLFTQPIFIAKSGYFTNRTWSWKMPVLLMQNSHSPTPRIARIIALGVFTHNKEDKRYNTQNSQLGAFSKHLAVAPHEPRNCSFAYSNHELTNRNPNNPPRTQQINPQPTTISLNVSQAKDQWEHKPLIQGPPDRTATFCQFPNP